ncbi:Alpha/Beta hydrolase protein [Pterulicium gracile]|uniref:Alpha/Beta hydrolase protein n=1 Tax=Pterulicium gracile TaxID=1884261 RepID=A0A5C3QLA3_9AGAR|nr:Alpha/Beta hydrolase protein [Pterula gracilis]
MLSVGYDEYVTQGGDWGYLVTRIIAQTYGPKHSKAWHTNHSRGAPPSLTSSPLLYLANLFTPLTEAEEKGAERTKETDEYDMGYFAEQTTRPQTLGYSLSHSPAGLLAWIYEKLIHWTNEYPWDDDEDKSKPPTALRTTADFAFSSITRLGHHRSMLTWISIYWFSKAGPAASLRIYYETIKHDEHGVRSSDAPTIPFGASFFPKEIIRHPITWIRNVHNLVFTSEYERGGHFASYERPDAIASDLRSMFGKEGPTHGVVKGLNGL